MHMLNTYFLEQYANYYEFKHEDKGIHAFESFNGNLKSDTLVYP